MYLVKHTTNKAENDCLCGHAPMPRCLLQRGLPVPCIYQWGEPFQGGKFAQTGSETSMGKN